MAEKPEPRPRPPSERRSIRERLERLAGRPPEPAAAPAPDRVAPVAPLESAAGAAIPGTAASDRRQTIDLLRRMVARVEPRPARPRPPVRQEEIQIEDIVAGAFEPTPFGPVFVAASDFLASYRHGRCPLVLDGLNRPIPERLARLARAPELAGADLGGLAFLDTETTGLATAAGTTVFLAGLGFFDGAVFRVEQLYLRDLNEEPAFLWLLAERLKRFAGLATYNGRAYDVPLLEARFITNRVFQPPIPVRHLDLLAPARRLWRARGAGCRLCELEASVLGVERVDDVPGDLIPALYFNALRQRNAGLVKQVFYHNGIDILSLAALAAVAAELLAADGSPDLPDGADLYSLGRIRETLGEVGAGDLYQAAVERGLAGGRLGEEALARLARSRARAGDLAAARSALDRLAELDGPLACHALIELAKLLEHHERDYRRAAELTRRALARLEATAAEIRRPREFFPHPAAIRHRLARLEARDRGQPWR